MNRPPKEARGTQSVSDVRIFSDLIHSEFRVVLEATAAVARWRNLEPAAPHRIMGRRSGGFPVFDGHYGGGPFADPFRGNSRDGKPISRGPPADIFPCDGPPFRVAERKTGHPRIDPRRESGSATQVFQGDVYSRSAARRVVGPLGL